MNIAELREIYSRSALTESESPDNPRDLFDLWFRQALEAELREPNAMALATASATGVPSVRIVLMKGIDERGIAFFTNYNSRKAVELAANPRASLLFFWSELERQVRFDGPVEKLSVEESREYFALRPEGSQIGAWASPQTQVIESRAWIEERFARMREQFAGAAVPCPEFWGGYLLRPETVEFWQGRPDRLHDRIRYRRMQSAWLKERLAP